jgi:asparagine synthase (glutamine-hydrolysing)
MCGILGFNWEDKRLLEKGLDAIKHRGPDAVSSYSDKMVSLGHARLSIIDLSRAGTQPLSNEDKSIWIIFNGEIYNHGEIKKSLVKKHTFSSKTDTEVILHLYEERGEDFVNYLSGMFAICIYDMKKKKLILVRDRLGLKPLYYLQKGSQFIFSSEIKTILQWKGYQKKVNLGALDSYLTFRANTSSETFFKDIKKLPPASILTYDLNKNNFKIKTYWSVSFNGPYSKDLSEDYFSKKIVNLLESAVRDRLMSEVPYGAYLSGGVDSGIIVSLMKKYSPKKVKTFSVGFTEQKYSEVDEANFLAKKLDTDHHELLIDSSSISALPKIVLHSDEPIADPTLIPTYFLSKYAKKYCTIVLTGEGSDEIFGGYAHYRFLNFHSKIISKIPFFIRKFSIKIFNKIPLNLLDFFFSFTSQLGEKGKERLAEFILSNDPNEQYLAQISLFSAREKKKLLTKKVANYKIPKISKKEIVNSAEDIDLKLPMVEDLLMKVDKMTMASGVEGRVPFLDPSLVELSSKIPSSMKVKHFVVGKHILRKSFTKLLPKQTRKRKKRYFFVPIESWVEHDLMPLRKKFFSREYLKKQGIFNYEYLEEISLNFKKSPLYYSRQLWALLIFQIWYSMNIKNETVKI